MPNKTANLEELTDTEEAAGKIAELRDRLSSAYQQLRERTVSGAKATDRAVRDYPYQALGIAFGLGLLIGVLAGRRR